MGAVWVWVGVCSVCSYVAQCYLNLSCSAELKIDPKP